ncbi:MAG TPA: type IX secretion system membrane protein PorP/SprF [Bacteroidales bacterium]
MRKYIIILSLGLAISGRLFGQQDAQFTLYMLNPIVYNPALAGTALFYQIRMNNRFQWVGFKDAPITNSISAYGPHAKKDMGFGGSIFNDITGPTSRTGFNAVYGYNIAVQKDIRVSFGLSVGLIQYKVDGTKIETYSQMESGTLDPSIAQSVMSTLVPDASAGVYAWNSQFYGGFSGMHLLDIFSKDSKKNIKGVDVLNTHFYLVGGYLYQINREWTLEPCMIVKKVVPAAYQMEISTKAIYKNMLWAGLAFRTQDAVSIVIGYTHDKKVTFGYAFDLAVNDIRRYNPSSHEIVLGYNFDKIKKSIGRGGGKKKK